MIRHLLISGGGIWGFSCYGALRESAKANFWNIDNIQSIYATSAGSILSVILSLKYDWETLDHFLIKRPWNQVFSFDFNSILSSIEKRGIFDKKNLYDLFTPLFHGKDISVDITMKEFYDTTQIDLHCFSTEINNKNIVSVDFSHTTHPDWKLLDAIYCSCCLPILFSPVLIEEKCFIDGGILNNYPLKYCLTAVQNHDEIFGIKKSCPRKQKLNEKSTLFDFLLYFITNIIVTIENGYTDVQIKNQLEIAADSTNLYDVYLATSSIDERSKLIVYGAEIWKSYSDERENYSEESSTTS
jgi:NTE family protein